jgi:hypothetical protein
MRSISAVNQVIDYFSETFGRDTGKHVAGIVKLEGLMQSHSLALGKREESSLEFFQAGNQEAMFGGRFDEIDEDVAGMEIDLPELVFRKTEPVDKTPQTYVYKIINSQHCL